MKVHSPPLRQDMSQEDVEGWSSFGRIVSVLIRLDFCAAVGAARRAAVAVIDERAVMVGLLSCC